MFNLALAVAIVALLHVATTAVAGWAMGVRLHWVAYGCGPALLRTRGFHLRALPIGGAVRFFHSVEDGLPEGDWHQALDRRPVPVQWLVMLSGCFVLLALVAAKAAALNLLPLPMLNGGAALAALAQRVGVAGHWPIAATRALLVAWLVVVMICALALGRYVLTLAAG